MHLRCRLCSLANSPIRRLAMNQKSRNTRPSKRPLSSCKRQPCLSACSTVLLLISPFRAASTWCFTSTINQTMPVVAVRVNPVLSTRAKPKNTNLDDNQVQIIIISVPDPVYIPPFFFLPMRRRSTVEVHPMNFSEAAHLRSSKPHAKTDFSKSQNVSRLIIP